MSGTLWKLLLRLRAQPWAHVAALILYGALAFLPKLGQEVDLANREARHAEISREMAASGQFLVPRLCGELYPDKAPLFNWTVASLFRLTGHTNYFLARLPSAVSAIAMLVAVYLLGRRWLSAGAGLAAAVLWGTSPLVTLWARQGRTDMLLACLLTYAALLADLAATSPAGRRRGAWWLGACGFVGLAALAKGLHAILYFAIAVAPLWRARQGRWAPPWRLALMAGGVFAALIGAWALAAEASYPGYLKAMSSHQLGVGLSQHAEPPWFYLVGTLLCTMPWALFAAGAGHWAARTWRRRGYRLALSPVLAFGAMLVLHSVVTNKRIHYMLPAIPWWVLWLAAFLAESAAPPEGEGRDRERAPAWAFQWPLLLLLAALLMVGVAGPFAWARHAKGALAAVTVLCVAVAALAAWGLAALWRRNLGRALAGLCASCAVLGAAWFPLWIGYIARPSKEVTAGREVLAAIPDGAPVAAYKSADEHILFKLKQAPLFPHTAAELRAFLEGAGPRYILTGGDSVAEVRALSARPLRVLSAWKTERDKGALLFADR